MSNSSPRLPSLPERPVDRVAKPLQDLLEVRSASGFLLLFASIVALLAANLGGAEAWHHLWETPIGLSWGQTTFSLSLHGWINDGLMAVFFFVVGLEIKRELWVGSLSDWQSAALPVVAAVGGAAVPAIVYVLMPAGSSHPTGWAVPMATDIAFVVGVLALLGDRVPSGLRVFMLTVAIVDDLIAIGVIAAFYSEGIAWPWLAAAGGALAAQLVLVRIQARSLLLFVPLALAIWACTLQAGIHPTVAGVALAFTIPLRPIVSKATAAGAMSDAQRVVEGNASESASRVALQRIRSFASRAVPPLDQLEESLAPWANFVVMPLFALANAGVAFSTEQLVHPVLVAVAVGLAIGKPLGLASATYLAVRSGMAARPADLAWGHVVGGGLLAGIGFTMALFIATLGLSGDALSAARTGILLGSMLAGGAGVTVLWFTPAR